MLSHNNQNNSKTSYFGMLVITWIMVFMTIPFFYQIWMERAEVKARLTECERMCYPDVSVGDGEQCCDCAEED